MAMNTHRWKFFRAGGFDQVRLASGADLTELENLDKKLWVALACPTTGVEFDAQTLNLIDTDKDGRIRASELIAATKWTTGLLKNPDDLLKGSAELPLSSINDSTVEGKRLLASARQVLTNLGKTNAAAVTIEDTTDPKLFVQTDFNGDGVIPADAAKDEAIKSVINDIIACFGPEADRSGKPGVNQAKVDTFFTEAQAFSDWWKQAETDPAINALGQTTPSAAAALQAVRQKVEDYFARCRVASFDTRALNALNRDEKDYSGLAGKSLTALSPELAEFPLAPVGAAKPLNLADGINPAWADRIAKFRTEAMQPV